MSPSFDIIVVVAAYYYQTYYHCVSSPSGQRRVRYWMWQMTKQTNGSYRPHPLQRRYETSQSKWKRKLTDEILMTWQWNCCWETCGAHAGNASEHNPNMFTGSPSEEWRKDWGHCSCCVVPVVEMLVSCGSMRPSRGTHSLFFFCSSCLWITDIFIFTCSADLCVPYRSPITA